MAQRVKVLATKPDCLGVKWAEKKGLTPKSCPIAVTCVKHMHRRCLCPFNK